jgi:hypothetical protein
MEIPLSLDEVDADYLTGVLRSTGLLKEGSVESFESQVIGEGAGFLGEIASLRLKLTGVTEGTPETVILKIPTTLKNREVGQTLGVYEREIRFYRELQSLLTIRTPMHYYSAMDATTDPEQGLKALKVMNVLPMWMIRFLLPLANWLNGRKITRYVLMMEHLGHHRVGDQVAGCSMEDASKALSTMARMHAQFWNFERFNEFPWLIPMEYVAKPTHMMYVRALDQFRETHSETLTIEQDKLLEFLKNKFFDLVATFEGRPRTLLHGDFRLDNLCFDDETGEVVLFDWQTLGVGSMGVDLGGRRIIKKHTESDEQVDELLEHYRAELAANGISMSREELLWEYECGLLFVLQRTVPALFQDMIALEGRGNDLIDTWIQRIFQKLGRIDPERLLVGPPAASAV